MPLPGATGSRRLGGHVPQVQGFRQAPGLHELPGRALQSVEASRMLEGVRQLRQGHDRPGREGTGKLGNVRHPEDIQECRRPPVGSRRVVEDDQLDAFVEQAGVEADDPHLALAVERDR
jgi:hypothetical protein